MDKARTKLIDLIDDFDVAMLTTYADGALSARPMSVAAFDEDSDSLCFSTSVHTEKVAEIEADPKVVVSFQSKTRFVSLSGEARVSNDRDRIHELYSTAWEIWYPDGPTQPDIRLIDFTANTGEYWDMSGLHGLRYAWEAGKAIVSGEPVSSTQDPEQHAQTAL